MIVLLAPHSTSLSGGYIYNQNITAELPNDRFRYVQLPRQAAADSSARTGSADEVSSALNSTSAPPPPQQLADFGVPPDATLLLDSLYFAFPDWVEELAGIHGGSLAMLVHYLPSLDPTTVGPVVKAKCRAEIRCMSCCDRIVVTSRYMQAEIRRVMAQEGSYRGFQSGGSEPDGCKSPHNRTVTVAPPGRTKSQPASGHRATPNGRIGTSERVAASSSTERSALQLLTVANWTAAKNHAYLLPLLEEFKELNWNWKIFGQADENGSLLEDFMQLAAECDLSERIRVEPQISPQQVDQQLQKADLFLYPSRFESYGMIIAEALSAGVPVIANHTGGIPEVVGDGPAAILCKSRDEHSARKEWHRALRKLMTDETARAEMRRAAVERARSLPNWSSTANTIFKALERDS